MLDSVCTKTCEGKSDATIKSETGMSDVSYVPLFQAKCGPYCPLNESQKGQICMFKGFGISEDQMVESFSDADPAEVRSVYQGC